MKVKYQRELKDTSIIRKAHEGKEIVRTSRVVRSIRIKEFRE